MLANIKKGNTDNFLTADNIDFCIIRSLMIKNQIIINTVPDF